MTDSTSKFSYEKLRVSQDILHFLEEAGKLIVSWDDIHAVVDQFDRASESILVNLAEGCRVRVVNAKQTAIDCGLGSVLECAACMDVAAAKDLVDEKTCRSQKQQLGVIFGKLIGLRNSWQVSEIRENSPEYGDETERPRFTFHHERLQAYQLSLGVVRELTSARLVERLSRGTFRRIDENATSIVLNIAEGNGRFAHLDHRRFLDIANRATTRLAVRLDICRTRGHLKCEEEEHIKSILARIDAMTAALGARWGAAEELHDRRGLRQGSGQGLEVQDTQQDVPHADLSP